jgi:integrase
MKGHIRKRSPGHWAIILDARDPQTGKRKRRWHSHVGTKRSAQIECARLISEIQKGTAIEPSRLTLRTFLLDRWHPYMTARISPRTCERYGELIRDHLIPQLGAIMVTKLRPAQIAEAYANALSAGRRDGKGGLSPSTVVYLHRVLKHALGDAVRWELVNRNPADAVEPPRVERGAVKTFDLSQTVELLSIVAGTRLAVPIGLAILCGLRRGEICALRWRHVDLNTGEIAVIESAEQTTTGIRYKSPKSGKARTVALSAMNIDQLRAHRLKQAEELLAIGVRQTEDTFVYVREDGEPMQPRSLTHAWQQMISKTKLPHLRFHDLRHSHATHLLGSGVHLKIASERLGHSKISTTADIYMHATKSMQADAAAAVDAALRDAINKRADAIG